ncbi:signal recognition particle receptor subunit alpha homolog [Drosophila sulfurigaster albostrigata]|uniref:signal recognition particle receptor subunit alpha homolog n=1 Tax=Drosophila sulfurigaster albostrigata TaxID=89887 RepID=UPI002D21EC2C|nr:signal recognition particle receptor subunit alpha homolog [Drosophila sulfurigaster albostrigata]
MLDFVVVFTKGGVVLWNSNESGQNYSSCINSLIRGVILEERNTESKYFEEDHLAVQFKLDNELDLVYAAVFQKVIKLNYLDNFLTEMQLAFKEKFSEIALGNDYDFEQEFRSVLSAAEEASAKQGKAPKAMRSYNESQKSKKTVASMIEDPKKSSSSATTAASEKRVNIQESPPSSTAGSPRSNEDIIQENRRKLREKLTPTKKAAQESRASKAQQSTQSEKAGKKPRVWDLGGNSKDAVLLDRSKDAPEDQVQVPSIHNELVGTMQGQIPDLDEQSDSASDESDVDDYEEQQQQRRQAAPTQRKPKSSSGLLSYFKGIVGAKTMTRQELQPALEKMRDHLISKNVASEIAAKLCDSVATSLEGKQLGTFDSIASQVRDALTQSLVRILSPKRRIDIIRDALESKRNGRPYTIIFCGVNGVGKSTNLAKICFWLIENDFNVLIAACDTFRAGAVEQLRTHTRHLNALHPPAKHQNRQMVQLYEKGYGKDAAGIAMEAIKFAHDTKVDVVLVDTAGRMQDNEPLMRSLSKLIKVNNPDLVLFVGEALVGNEAVDQLVKFNQSLADYSSHENPHIIDGIVLTKFDTIDDKVGAAISMTYITGQPIVFVGTGQTYADLKAINVNAVVSSLMK